MDCKEAKIILEKYVFWRDVRIPILEDQLNSLCSSSTANYSGSIRGTNISDPTKREAEERITLEMELADLRNKVRAVEYVKKYLDEDLLPAFRFLIYPRKQSWAEMADHEKSGMTEQEFRTRRRKILNYTREAFEGLSFVD
jgi:hypothetical protein